MKKVIRKLKSVSPFILIPVSQFFLLRQRVFAAELEPVRVSDFENYFIQALAVIWALTIPYFIFIVISIGASWMTSAGDEAKVAAVKKRAGNFVLSFALVFGGWIVVKLIIDLFGVKQPGPCFSGTITKPFFQIFFPNICT